MGLAIPEPRADTGRRFADTGAGSALPSGDATTSQSAPANSTSGFSNNFSGSFDRRVGQDRWCHPATAPNR
jgi:hypothetical protein